MANIDIVGSGNINATYIVTYIKSKWMEGRIISITEIKLVLKVVLNISWTIVFHVLEKNMWAKINFYCTHN